jgi:hypothetical protein
MWLNGLGLVMVKMKVAGEKKRQIQTGSFLEAAATVRLRVRTRLDAEAYDQTWS